MHINKRIRGIKQARTDAITGIVATAVKMADNELINAFPIFFKVRIG